MVKFLRMSLFGPCLAFALALAQSAGEALAAIPGSGAGLPTLAPVLEGVTPGVVNISVLSRQPQEENPLMRDPFFRRFFNLPEQPRDTPPRMSAGSGVIVDARQGYVLTNHHVIQNASEIMVTLKDRRRLKASLIGTDPATDIAVLKIEASDLVALPLGDSDALKVGDFVIAVGNPFGLGQTVTSGIVSALGRGGLNIEGYEDFIQTDASINPGNSGGALVDLRGQLIGINTAIIAPAGGNVGIGFAIPTNMVKAVMDQLIRYGEVRRGQLGVVVQDVTPDIAHALGMERLTGAMITRVNKGSAAEAAGLKTGDVIVEMNGKVIEDASDLRNRVGLVPTGERLELSVNRNGKLMTLRATVRRG